MCILSMPSSSNVGILKRERECKGAIVSLKDGKPHTRSHFVQETQKALRSRGISAVGYSGHSFRCGAATTAVARGLGETTINMLGR